MNFFTFTKLARAVVLAAVMVAVLVGTAAAQSGTFTDSRDGQKYKTVVIGGKKWMAQNLNYQTGDSWCYEDSNANCGKYGRLYDWNTAKAACPSGWHLPSREEWWGGLVEASNGVDNAGKKLKAKSGWGGGGNGRDEFGFSALPSGFRDAGGLFGGARSTGYWWTSTEGGVPSAYDLHMISASDGVGEGHHEKSYGSSVRCVAD